MNVDAATVAARRRAFRALHQGPELLIIPNGWDVVTSRIFEEAGFPAVATSSAAVANALGYPDGNALDVDLHLATIERIVRALNVPVSADVESGYSSDTEALGEFITRLAATGVAGYNLEDVKGDGELYPLDVAVARVRAARAAAPDVFLNARTDIYLMGIGPEETRLGRTLERLDAFADAGADGVFVPGVMDPIEIGKLSIGTRRPLNVLAGPNTPDRRTLQALRVNRVSVGSGPMRRTLGVLRAIAQELRDAGTFSYTREPSVPYDELNALMRRP
jgi:2-methylisocitrate lyase-like PEP mutase family enzyme